MKGGRNLALCLLLGVLLTLSACAPGNGPRAVAPALEPGIVPDSAPTAVPSRTGGRGTELTVFACSSLRNTLEEIAALYRRQANVTIRFCFDGSGTLLERLKEGAACDLFLSASPAQMDAIDGSLLPEVTRNPDRPALLDSSSRTELLYSGLILAVPEGNPGGISGFEDLALSLRAQGAAREKPLLAMGGNGDPEGQYAREVLRSWQVDAAALNRAGVAVCSSEQEIIARLADGSAECGILFSTERGNFTVVDTAPAEYVVRYSAAVLADSAQSAAAHAFLEYLTGAEAAAVFEAAGFTRSLPESVPETEDFPEADAFPEAVTPPAEE